MAENNSLVLPHRSYLEGFKARNEALWNKIKNNPFVNMVFPVKEVSEGNTEALLQLVVPGGNAIKTTVKTIENLPLKTTKLVKKASRPKGGSVSYVDMSADDFWYQLETGITPKRGEAPKNNFRASRHPASNDNWNGSWDNITKEYKFGGTFNYLNYIK